MRLIRHLILVVVMGSIAGPAAAYLSEALEIPEDGGVAAAMSAPFPALEGDQQIGAITLVRQGLTGEVRVRAENCTQLIDVYADGSWTIQSQDTAYYTSWLIARCQALALLEGPAREGADLRPPLPLSFYIGVEKRLPAQFAPYNDCISRVSQIRAAMIGGTMMDQMIDGSWTRQIPDKDFIATYEDKDGNELEVELLAAYRDKESGHPVWVLLATNTDGLTGASHMDVWPVTVRDEAAAPLADDELHFGPLKPYSDMGLLKAALETCPAFLPALLEPEDCPEQAAEAEDAESEQAAPTGDLDK